MHTKFQLIGSQHEYRPPSTYTEHFLVGSLSLVAVVERSSTSSEGLASAAPAPVDTTSPLPFLLDLARPTSAACCSVSAPLGPFNTAEGD